MTMDLRVLDEADWDTWYGSLELAFGGLPEAPEERELWQTLTEPERSLGIWDGGRVVGTSGAFSFRMSVPGGAVLPTAGVTMVSVASTHRRQGLLRRMMRRLLDDAREAGEPLAVLTASEPAIYGRFGFGVATWELSTEIDATRVTLARPAGTGEGADGLRLRLADPAEALERCEELYARLVPTRPGMLERRPRWERLALLDPPRERQGASALQCVLAERDGELLGYARYALKPEWDEAGPKGTVLVRQLDALEPAAYAALLEHLCGVDLMTRVRLTARPADDPLLHLASDVRRCQPRLRDGLYLRPVELGAALSGRAYAAELDVVLGVTDAFCPWNEGAWRLSGGPGGARCERTGDAPELALSAAELGAAYLGGASLPALAAAGRVRELRPGALAATAAAFASPVAPWLPHPF